MTELRNSKLEAVAKAISIGATASEASRMAGYPKGSSFAPNARKRANRKDVIARVAELRAPQVSEDEASLRVTRQWMLAKIFRIADPDLDEYSGAEQIAALRLGAQITGTLAPEKHEHLLRAVDTMTDDELARIAAGGSPRALAAPLAP